MPRSLILVGAGHAHLIVLERLAANRLGSFRGTLVSPAKAQIYSGMLPGLVAGRYRLDQVAVALPELAKRAGVEFRLGRATGLDAVAHRLGLADAPPLDFDLISFATGAPPAGAELAQRVGAVLPRSGPGAARLLRDMDRIAADRRDGARIVVVGGGMAGSELALALRTGFGRRGVRPSIVVLEREAAPEAPGRWRRLRAAEFRRAEVELRTASEVTGGTVGRLELSDGTECPADLVVWSTGPGPIELFNESGLPTAPDGRLLVDRTLRSLADPEVFATGDAAALIGYGDQPRAGVVAVRQGAVLARNLGATRDGAPLGRFRPRRRWLGLLDTGRGALLSYGSVALRGRWAGLLKRWIDRRFMARFPSRPPRRSGPY